ncbi:hypothetical protein C900_00156 [Fulvivirga imtechensis AK7]|uniref:histidine kinase n=1 Tax=Fulvivirga imtechensis AK7 TaxID=1237149 RepID=L8JVJ5_9BACT|nr:ATP-binding protein [Fulvivirga imtechensis]ELR73076.1 hypothetical protein C900_00156 [Fulvivirga imtechensis AK7]
MEREEKSNLPSAKSDVDPAILRRAFERERQAKRAAEKIIEEKSTELYYANKELATLNESLEKQVAERTAQLKEALTRAEESAKAKETFLANMSHEIRTPMNSIIGFVNLLLKSSWQEKEMSYLNAIKSSSNNLLVLINDILDLSKISSGNLRLERIEFDLKDLIKETVYNFQERATAKGLALHCQTEPQIANTFLGDPIRIQQILNNIIGNALKFTEKGSISITAKVLVDKKISQTIEFKIADTGIGISAEKIDTIFESFMQEDDSTTRQYGGTGLGLAICKQLIELLKGEIKVQSTKNIGTEFLVSIPLKKTKQMNKKELPPMEGSRNKFKGAAVLVAEDNHFNQLLIENILVDNSFEVDIVENGHLAIEKIKSKDYDIVLMDIQMPVMGGVEATSIIRKELKLNLPIIALTANALKGDEVKYLNCGMDAYISKPFEEEDLINKLNTLISKYRKGFDLINIRKIAKGDNSFIVTILNQFLKDIAETLPLLNECEGMEGMADARKILHSLKSSVKIMEINDLDNTIKQIELWDGAREDIDSFYNLLYLFRERAADVFLKIKDERDILLKH